MLRGTMVLMLCIRDLHHFSLVPRILHTLVTNACVEGISGCCLQGFKLFVGRSYRTVDRLDVVPALPAFTGYVQLDYSMWIQVSIPISS